MLRVLYDIPMRLVLDLQEYQLILEPFLVLYDLPEEIELLHRKTEGSHESYEDVPIHLL
jgi:hypothetical protein